MTNDEGFVEPAPDATFADVFERLPMDRLLGIAEEAGPARVEAAFDAGPLERTLEDRSEERRVGKECRL